MLGFNNKNDYKSSNDVETEKESTNVLFKNQAPSSLFWGGGNIHITFVYNNNIC